jgi:hypothetical protein
MTSLTRPALPASTQLLMRILERPGLVAAVRELPGAVLGKLVDRIGLEDAGELVALASTAQLERIFDDDLWRADRAGDDETFRPDRFALWLRLMAEAGDDHLARRLCELPQDLVALAVHRLVLVLDMDVVAEQLGWAGKDAAPIEDALESSTFEEWEEFRLIARDRDAWEEVWNALLSLDRDHHDRLRAILEQCCAMSTEYISGQGGLFEVLTADEMLEGDVAAARDDRRVAEGFISPADARAFLELARRGGGGEGRDPITQAYFRGLEGIAAPKPKAAATPREHGSRVQAGQAPNRRTEVAATADVMDLAALLREAEVIAPPAARPLAALAPAGTPPAEEDSKQRREHLVAPLLERAMSDLRQRDPALFAERAREIGYLVNVWIVGGAHEGQRPRPVEALEMVLGTCEAGLLKGLAAGRVTPRQALTVLMQTPADTLFRRGFRNAEGGRHSDTAVPRRSRPRRT